MSDAHVSAATIFHPLTPDRSSDLEALFGPREVCAGCWCMWWRLPRSTFAEQSGEGNRAAFEEIVRSGDEPGILAYVGGRPVGWCAVAPRAAYPTLERSRNLRRVDAVPVWSVICFFVARVYWRRGLAVRLLDEAVRHAAAHGAQVVEGYPVEPKGGYMSDAGGFHGDSGDLSTSGLRRSGAPRRATADHAARAIMLPRERCPRRRRGAARRPDTRRDPARWPDDLRALHGAGALPSTARLL